MSRRRNRKHVRFAPQVVRLEDRNAASDTLHFLLGTLGIASVFDTSSLDSTTPPSMSLSAVDSGYLNGSTNSSRGTNVALNPVPEPATSDRSTAESRPSVAAAEEITTPANAPFESIVFHDCSPASG
jgi:hypothetical protein